MSRLHPHRIAVPLLALLVSAAPAAAQSVINQYSLGSDIQPLEITAGPDGNLWYTVNGDGTAGSSKVGRITPAGVVTEFVLADTSRPVGITAGPDGKIWFTESGANPPNPPGAGSIGRVDPATFPAGGSVTHFTTGISFGSSPFGICAGPDGALWFTERNNSGVARITTAGTVTQYSISSTSCGTPPPNNARGATPLGIAAGPDGHLWVTDRGSPSSIIVMSTAGTVVKRIDIPTVAGNPSGITAGPDGRMWFVEVDGPKVGVLATTATCKADVTEYATPTTLPYRITNGPDGNLWFSENGGGAAGRVSRITTAGTITEYTTTGLAGPYDVCVGPDRAVWFTEKDPNAKVGQLLVDCVVTLPTITGGGSQCGGTTLTLTASAGWTSYQWYRNGAAIPGATSATFTKTATTNDSGNYTVSGTNGACTSNQSAFVPVTITGPTTATTGGPQSICPNGTTAGLGGNTPTVGTGAWSVVSGGTGTFSPNATTPNATFTHTGGTGPIVLAWTITSPPCPDSVANVTITIACPGTTIFYTATPCRQVDTRLAANAPALAAGEQRTFVLTGAPCGLPSTTKAVSVNVTVTGPTAGGDLKSFATGVALPTATIINFSAGQTRANNGLLAVDGSGHADVKNDASGTVHVIIDVNGYFK
jgi:virginiamycin B lyase